jgi:hypothetical protein
MPATTASSQSDLEDKWLVTRSMYELRNEIEQR